MLLVWSFLMLLLAEGQSSWEDARDYPPGSYVESMKYLLHRGVIGEVIHKHCVRGSHPKPRGDLPVYALVIGVEGAGHHLLHNMLQPAVTKAIIASPHVHTRHGCCSARLYQQRKRFRKELRTRIFKGVGRADVVLGSADSFPEGRTSAPMRHPDIGSLLELDGDLFDFKGIVLVRSLLESFVSRKAKKFSRKFHGDPALEAAIHLEESLVINSIVSNLPCDKYVFMPIDYAVEKPSDALALLSTFLGINATLYGKKPDRRKAFPWHWKAGFSFGNTSLSLVKEYFGANARFFPLLDPGSSRVHNVLTPFHSSR